MFMQSGTEFESHNRRIVFAAHSFVSARNFSDLRVGSCGRFRTRNVPTHAAAEYQKQA